MDSPGGGAAAAADPAPQRPPYLLTLPELDRPPAVLNLSELEAVAAALPGKKRRLRETFERLAASSPAPLPFSWEDLDAHISSFQYSVTLRFHQLRAEHNQVPLPAPVPLPAAVSVPAADGDGVPEKGKKRKASSQAADAHEAMHKVDVDAAAVEKALPLKDTDGALAEKGKKQKAPSGRAAEADDAMRKLDEVAAEIKKAPPLGDTDGNGTRLCPAPPGIRDGLTVANGSRDATVPLDPINKVAVVRQECPVTTRRPPNATRLVKAGVAGQRRRPPRPVPTSAAVSAPAVAGGDLGKAENSVLQKRVKKISESHSVVERKKVEKTSESHKAGEAKVSASPHADGVGNMTVVGGTNQDMQVDPVCNVTAAVRNELPLAACGPSGDAANVVPAVAVDSTSLLVSKDPKLESSVEAADVEMQVVAVIEESTPEVIKAVAPAPAADNSLPLQCKGQEDCKVSPLPLSSGNGVAGAGANAGTAMHADAALNTSAQANLPTFRPKIQNKLFVRNHGGRPVGSKPVLNAQGANQGLKKEPGPGKAGPGRILSAAGKGGIPLANNSRNNGNGKGKPWVHKSSENGKHSNKFCYKCGSEGHVTHKCRTPEHLVELYLQDKKKKVGIHQICYRCGTRGHMARKCRTPQHLVDLYQNHRAAKKASLETGVSQSNIS